MLYRCDRAFRKEKIRKSRTNLEKNSIRRLYTGTHLGEEKGTYSLLRCSPLFLLFPSTPCIGGWRGEKRGTYIRGNCRFHREGEGGRTGQKVGRSKPRPFAEKAPLSLRVDRRRGNYLLSLFTLPLPSSASSSLRVTVMLSFFFFAN